MLKISIFVLLFAYAFFFTFIGISGAQDAEGGITEAPEGGMNPLEMIQSLFHQLSTAISDFIVDVTGTSKAMADKIRDVFYQRIFGLILTGVKVFPFIRPFVIDQLGPIPIPTEEPTASR